MTNSLSLYISDDLELPAADAATGKFAFLGISGSGKTYGCGKFVEEIIRVGTQTFIFDTIGNWHGLRTTANGKGAGLQIPVLGGVHADIALDPSHGKLVAQMFIGSGASMIVDVSEFTGAEIRRFLVDFATEALMLGLRAPAPRHMVWEECQDYLPQKVFGDEMKVLGAMQRLIKKGRNAGFGHSLISQRVAAVNKEALYQCHTLFSFRTIGKLDRKAIEDYVHDHDDEEVTGKNRPPLSKLETGECLVFSPHWLKVSKRIKIAKKWTYDASATPDFTPGAAPRTFALSKVDLAKFKIAFGDAIQKAKDNDPDELKKRIRELEALTVDGAMKPATDEYKAKYEERDEEIIRLRTRLSDIATRTSTGVVPIINSTVDGIRALENEIMHLALGPENDRVVERVREAMPPREVARQIPMRQNMVVPSPPAAERTPVLKIAGGLSAMERAFLTVLAQRGGAIAKGKILAFADYATSGKCGQAFARLIAEGWAESPTPGSLSITAMGRKQLGTYERRPVGDALYQSIENGSRLNTMEKAFLREIRRSYPGSVGKGVIRADANYASSGKCGQAFARLVRLGYATKDGPGFLRLSDDLVDHPVKKAV